jgi:hypothetical protein
MQIIYCCPIKLGGELFNYTGFLSPLSFSLPLEKLHACTTAIYTYSKDDVRSPLGAEDTVPVFAFGYPLLQYTVE